MKRALPPDFLKIPLAHRALHDATKGRPENSRAAVIAAVDAGYGIEIDLQQSADGKAMVFHDYDLSRLSQAQGDVHSFSAEQLSQMPLRGANEGIPQLPEILRLVDGRVPLLIEIKDQDGSMGNQVGHLEADVAYALSDYSGPVAVMSFNPHTVAAMARLCPAVPRGLVTDAYQPGGNGLPADVRDRLREIPDYARTQSSFISHDWRDLERDRVAELKAQGADILCWTVKSPQEEAQARKIAQNITFEQYLAPFPA